jgi:hypothetical protein
MANQEDGFLREVEEEIRRERLERLWKEYGTFFLAGAALIVIGVLGYKFVENRRATAAQTTGERYEGAMELASTGKDGSAEKEFESIVADGSGGYPELARLQLGGVLLKQDKKPEAVAVFDELAKSANADPLLRDYAALQAASARMGTADFTEMQNRLTPLMADTSPWRYSARELMGVAAFKAGKADEARNVLTPLLVDQKTPQSIAERAQIVLAELAAAEIGRRGAAEPLPPGAPAPAVVTLPDAGPPGAPAPGTAIPDTGAPAEAKK